jgi:hypothetical protein
MNALIIFFISSDFVYRLLRINIEEAITIIAYKNKLSVL